MISTIYLVYVVCHCFSNKCYTSFLYWPCCIAVSAACFNRTPVIKSFPSNLLLKNVGILKQKAFLLFFLLFDYTIAHAVIHHSANTAKWAMIFVSLYQTFGKFSDILNTYSQSLEILINRESCNTKCTFLTDLIK